MDYLCQSISWSAISNNYSVLDGFGQKRFQKKSEEGYKQYRAFQTIHFVKVTDVYNMNATEIVDMARQSSLFTSICSYKPHFFEYEEENISAVHITSKGELIELDHYSHIQCRCELFSNVCCSNATLKTYYTYEPFYKFYLAFIPERLYIIKKVSKRELQLQKVVNNVSKFSVEDSDNTGSSDIIVYVNDSNLPSILKLKHDKEFMLDTKVMGNSLMKVGSFVQAMNVRLLSAKQVLGDKRIFITKLAETLCHSNFSESGIPMIQMIGENTLAGDVSQNLPVSIGKPWVRIWSNTWIVGIYVANNNDLHIVNLEISGIGSTCFIKRTNVFSQSGLDESLCLVSQMKRRNTLPPFSQGYVVGVMEVPFFVRPSLTLSLILNFNVDKNPKVKQKYLGEINVSLQDVLSCNFTPFLKESEVSDLLSVIAVCQTIDITCNVPSQVVSNTLKDLGFKQLLNNDYFINKLDSHSSLKGVLIKVDRTGKLKIFFRRRQQLAIILSLLKELLPSPINSDEDKLKSLKTACISINEEVRDLSNYISSRKDANEVHDPIKFHLVSKLLSNEARTDLDCLFIVTEKV